PLSVVSALPVLRSSQFSVTVAPDRRPAAGVAGVMFRSATWRSGYLATVEVMVTAAVLFASAAAWPEALFSKMLLKESVVTLICRGPAPGWPAGKPKVNRRCDDALPDLIMAPAWLMS